VQIKAIRREMRLLRYYALVMTMLAGAFLIGAVAAAKKASFDTITVHRIDVTDREGKLAMIITDHDDFPPPIVNGKVWKRQGGADSNGIVFYNQQGDEQGALDWAGRIAANGTYESASTLSYDSVVTDQMLQVDNGNDNGKTYAFMIGWNRPNMHTPEFQKTLEQLQTYTPAQLRAFAAAHPGFGGNRRFMFGYDTDNTSQVVLDDANGKPRIKMYVTAEGQAALQFLDASGKVTSQFPPAQP
jgi:hypothetical protein